MKASTIALHAFIGALSTVAAAARTSCKNLPGDPDWPQDESWNQLNRTVAGRLIATIPVASICHVGGRYDGRFDASTCATLRSGWNFAQAHFPFPGEFSFPWYQNKTCDPFTPASKPCELGNYVAYSINVTGADDVAAGIRFAKENNVRLVIKNTGHDYLGKSSGKGGLELWTHNLKSREVIEDYSSDYYEGPALKLGAGVQGLEAYETANQHGYRVVGGSCPTVGIVGGYSQGGGHSALSSIHGLSADNILEWEVVTAEGEHLIASPSKNQDLYWALGGGGGGTYAVVLSMTTRLHADGSISGAYLRFNDGNISNDAYWDAINAFHSYIPDMMTDGITALYSIYNNTFNLFSVSAPNKTTYEVVSRFEPILAELDKRGINFSFDAHTSPTFFDHYVRDFGPLPNGYFSAGQLTSSRLVPRDVLRDSKKNKVMTKAIRDTAQNGDFFVACQALDVSDKSRSVAPNAVLPAWRDAAAHCIVVGLWDYSLPRDVMEARQKRIEDEINPMLAAATPGSGTYLNEANFRQADFQTHFFGDNYDKLLEVKMKYDPDDVFYVTTGVGSDAFVVDDNGRLCKA